MKLEDLVSGLSNKSTDELLDLIHEIRKDRTTRKPTPAAKKTAKTAESKVLTELANLGSEDLEKLLSLLGES